MASMKENDNVICGSTNQDRWFQSSHFYKRLAGPVGIARQTPYQ